MCQIESKEKRAAEKTGKRNEQNVYDSKKAKRAAEKKGNEQQFS